MQNSSENAIVECQIRIASECDMESLAAALAPEPSAAHLAQRFEDSRTGIRTMLVAAIDGCAVGTISIGEGQFQRRGSLRLFALDVGPAFRRKGVGSALVHAVESIAAKRGLDAINLEVETDNEGAIRLYRRLGYLTCGPPVMDRWTRFWDDGTSETIEVPVFVMVKKLD